MALMPTGTCMNKTDKPLTIAMIAACSFPGNHGTPASVMEMSRQLYRRGHTVHIITYPTRDYECGLPFSIHRAGSSRLFSSTLGIGPSLKRILFDFFMVFKGLQVTISRKADIIHAHNYEGQIAGFIISMLTGRPVVYHAHNTMIDELGQYNFIKSAGIVQILARFLDTVVPRTADRIIAISRNVKSFLLDQGISLKKMVTIPLFVAMPSFNLKENSGTGAVSLPEGHKIIYTGTLDTFQRLDYLLQAFAKVAGRVPSAQLLLAVNHYKNEQLDTLKTTARMLGIADRVHFYLDTTVEQLPHFLVNSDVAVIPRPSCPGLPIKMFNYMAAGKAIVAFKGSIMLLQHNESAVLADDHDVDGLADGILRCLQEDAFRHRIGRNAELALAQLRPEYLTQQIESVYKSLVS